MAPLALCRVSTQAIAPREWKEAMSSQTAVSCGSHRDSPKRARLVAISLLGPGAGRMATKFFGREGSLETVAA